MFEPPRRKEHQVKKEKILGELCILAVQYQHAGII
jgi:hypothetical protein